MTLAQLKRLCTTWQKRLRITDWRVSITWGTAEEMDGCLGRTAYSPREMLADVEILPDQSDERYADGGIEATVIHELLHVVMHGDKEYRKEDIMQERGINQVADALYRAYRRK